ncbi:MAG: ZIP family metal transporter [Clostridia bacterium]|nr:ZIP family metal transporter [Clostridia bacterium]
MSYLINITLIGLISGIIGTGIGGLMALFIKGVSKRLLGFILEFSAGLMTAVVCFELIPEAFDFGGAVLTLIGVLAGIVVILILEDFIRKFDFVKKGSANSDLLRAGILTSIGIALHNFPEGFAVGSGFEASVSLGLTLTAVIAIHDIPEGIAMAVPMRAGGFSRLKAFLLTVLSGVPMGLGALIGAALGGLSKQFIAVCLGFAGGAMLYIIFGQLIPESKKIYLGRLSSLGNILGILCGIVVSVCN